MQKLKARALAVALIAAVGAGLPLGLEAASARGLAPTLIGCAGCALLIITTALVWVAPPASLMRPARVVAVIQALGLVASAVGCIIGAWGVIAPLAEGVLVAASTAQLWLIARYASRVPHRDWSTLSG